MILMSLALLVTEEPQAVQDLNTVEGNQAACGSSVIMTTTSTGNYDPSVGSNLTVSVPHVPLPDDIAERGSSEVTIDQSAAGTVSDRVEILNSSDVHKVDLRNNVVSKWPVYE